RTKTRRACRGLGCPRKLYAKAEAGPYDTTAAGAGASAANARRRRNSRRRSSRLIVSAAKIVTADSSHTHRSVNPGILDRNITGIAVPTIRVNDLTSEGIVLPIAWNMLEATKMIPDAM